MRKPIADKSPDPITCRCGTRIGEEIEIQGDAVIHAGGGMWHDLRGCCAQCGEPFYWSAKGKQIQRAFVVWKKIKAGGEQCHT
jgi:hypothetical protein